ncbi:hypothetical protein SCUP515_10031 [Seiridium cupressi]
MPVYYRVEKIEGAAQTFFVVGPKFNLPPGSVDSVFPVPGANAEVNVLPHIVLKDPHLPWGRELTYIAQNEDKGDEHHRTPWLALLVFTVPELHVEPNDVKNTYALRMRARDTLLLDGITNAISYDKDEDGLDAAEPVDVVLLEPDLFTALFSEDNGGGVGQGLCTSKYKHLAHVRETATDGMAVAGNVEDNENDPSLFSVVVSPRTSVIGADVPTTTIVHLVSLAMKPRLSLPFPKGQQLHQLFDSLVNLGKNLKVLQPQMPPDSAKQDENLQREPPFEDDKIASLITRRQMDGYIIVRHQMVSGEVTASITRGPLTPTYVPHPLRNGFMQSNFGTDLQILDPDLSLMDLTYCSAWQLGKTLAMADQAFSTALARLRNAIHSQALSASKKEDHAALGAYRSRSETAGDMLELTRDPNKLNTALHQGGSSATAFDINRWHHADRTGDGLAQDATAAAAQYDLASDGHLYNEYSMPNSPDYAHVYSWVLDKVHLGNVPAHYLIPDPSYLPEETLRFFHVDENWTDALIDGALSLASHRGAEPEKDYDRTAIKDAINARLNTPDEALGGWHVQMPKYGFLLRSQIIVQFPDLSVTVRFSTKRPESMNSNISPTPSQAPILVQKLLPPDTILCLFDCAPPGLARITFTLPPHQQRFLIGQTLTEDQLTVLYKKISTTSGYVPSEPGQGLGSRVFDKNSADPAPPFDWRLWTMHVRNYGQQLIDILRDSDDMMEHGKHLFGDTFITSAVMALQLNDPILQFVVGDLNKTSPDSPGLRFQLSTPPGHSSVHAHPPPHREAELVAQHAANIGIQKQSESMASASLRIRNPATPTTMMAQPAFDFKIYPVRRRDCIPSNIKLPIELIFSIRQSEPAPFLTNLVKLVVAVPHGKVPASAKISPPLSASRWLAPSAAIRRRSHHPRPQTTHSSRL